ncbi:hypothetical protein ACVXZ4_13135 [Lacisediminihabitans sp. FW035]
MNIFIIGISGRIGGLLAEELIARGDSLSRLVRSHAQRVSVESRGGRAQVGDLAEMTSDELAGVDQIALGGGGCWMPQRYVWTGCPFVTSRA